MIVEYLTIYDQGKVEKITAFLKKQLE